MPSPSQPVPVAPGLGWSPAKPGFTPLDHGAEDLWNKTKALNPTLRAAMEQLENDPNHYYTLQTEGPWPAGVAWKPTEWGKTSSIVSKQQAPDGSTTYPMEGGQIFLRQQETTDLNPALPEVVLAHEVGHIQDKLSYSNDLTPIANQMAQNPDIVHAPDTICTQLENSARDSLNLPQSDDIPLGGFCSPDHPLWELSAQPIQAPYSEP